MANPVYQIYCFNVLVIMIPGINVKYLFGARLKNVNEPLILLPRSQDGEVLCVWIKSLAVIYKNRLT